jgi:hypothetical protein
MSIEVESHTEFPFPAITICNKTAFKNSQRNLDIHVYLENTLDESDFLLGVTTHTGIVQAGKAGHIVTFSLEITNYVIFVNETSNNMPT